MEGKWSPFWPNPGEDIWPPSRMHWPKTSTMSYQRHREKGHRLQYWEKTSPSCPLLQDHQPDLFMCWWEPRPQTRIWNEWVWVKSMKKSQAKSQTSSQGGTLVKETRKIIENFIETAESYTTRKPKGNLCKFFKNIWIEKYNCRTKKYCKQLHANKNKF